MDVVLGTEDAVAAKDRLYRALDKAIEHKEALEQHLAERISCNRTGKPSEFGHALMKR